MGLYSGTAPLIRMLSLFPLASLAMAHARHNGPDHHQYGDEHHQHGSGDGQHHGGVLKEAVEPVDGIVEGGLDPFAQTIAGGANWSLTFTSRSVT